MSEFYISSPLVEDGGTLPMSAVFDGGNQSLPLKWHGAPEGTKSYAISCYDPDAPTGSGFWHWMVINIPASVTELPADAGRADNSLLPAGARQMRSDYGDDCFGGANPPKGDQPHRYIFTVMAISEEALVLPPDITTAATGFNLHFKTLAKASFTAYFGQ